MLSLICNLCLQVAAFIDNFGIVRPSTALKRSNSGLATMTGGQQAVR